MQKKVSMKKIVWIKEIYFKVNLDFGTKISKKFRTYPDHLFQIKLYG